MTDISHAGLDATNWFTLAVQKGKWEDFIGQEDIHNRPLAVLQPPPVTVLPPKIFAAALGSPPDAHHLVLPNAVSTLRSHHKARAG